MSWNLYNMSVRVPFIMRFVLHRLIRRKILVGLGPVRPSFKRPKSAKSLATNPMVYSEYLSEIETRRTTFRSPFHNPHGWIFIFSQKSIIT